jgi:hypothetical protein
MLVTLSGFDAVASRFGIDLRCNWNWPSTPGYSTRPFAPEPKTLHYSDWVFEETDCGPRLYEHGSGRVVDPLPKVLPVNEPEFNSVLARRLLRSWLYLQEEGATRIAIYGAGGHTNAVLQWGVPDSIELVAVVGANASLTSMNVDAVLLSSSSFESDMLEQCQRHGIRNVVPLYSDWPRDMAGVLVEAKS